MRSCKVSGHSDVAMVVLPAVSIRRALAVPCSGIALLLFTSCGSSSVTTTAPAPARCAVQAQAASSSFPVAGGSGSLTITTNRECAWSVRSQAPWLTTTGPASGQGDGEVKFSVTANPDPSERTGALDVNDQRLSITQAGKPCEFQLCAGKSERPRHHPES